MTSTKNWDFLTPWPPLPCHHHTRATYQYFCHVMDNPLPSVRTSFVNVPLPAIVKFSWRKCYARGAPRIPFILSFRRSQSIPLDGEIAPAVRVRVVRAHQPIRQVNQSAQGRETPPVMTIGLQPCHIHHCEMQSKSCISIRGSEIRCPSQTYLKQIANISKMKYARHPLTSHAMLQPDDAANELGTRRCPRSYRTSVSLNVRLDGLSQLGQRRGERVLPSHSLLPCRLQHLHSKRGAIVKREMIHSAKHLSRRRRHLPSGQKEKTAATSVRRSPRRSTTALSLSV